MRRIAPLLADVLGCTSVCGLRQRPAHLSLETTRGRVVRQFVFSPLTQSRENGTAIVLIDKAQAVLESATESSSWNTNDSRITSWLAHYQTTERQPDLRLPVAEQSPGPVPEKNADTANPRHTLLVPTHGTLRDVDPLLRYLRHAAYPGRGRTLT
jgi:hypothetical protein